MRNLIKPTLILVTAFLFILNLNAQTEISQPQTKIVHEFVDGKFNHLKATHGNVEVIFRNDRLEIFESSPTNDDEKQSFLFFDESNKVTPEPEGLQSQSKKPIDNPNMAAVLGVQEMNVSTYERVVYRNLYKGADLIITVNGQELNFIIENKTDQVSIPFGLSTWGDSEMVKLNDIIKLQKHNSLELTSPSNMDVKGKALDFSATKSKTNKISFTLNFLN